MGQPEELKPNIVEVNDIETEVCVPVKIKDGAFKIDFNQVLDRIHPLIGVLQHPGFDGESLAQDIFRNKRYSMLQGAVRLGAREDVEVIMHFGRMGVRFDFGSKGEITDRWTLEGTVVAGSLEDPDEWSAEQTPSLTFLIQPINESGLNRPTISQETRDRIRGLAETIATFFG